MSISPSYTIKCLFGGEPSVGKTSMIHLLKHEYHDPNLETTIGMNFSINKVELEKINWDKKDLPLFYLEENPKKTCQIVKTHLWDAAGSMRFRSIVQSYMRDLDIVFLIFDINDRNSWNSLVKWKEEIDKFKKYDELPMYVLVGNKSDVHAYQVSIGEIDERCQQWNAKRYLVSCTEQNSLGMLKRILYNSVLDYHTYIVNQVRNGKSIPEHITLSHCSRKKYELEIDGEPSHPLCCSLQ